MAKLVWDQPSEKTFELGVEQCALYVMDSTGAYPQGVAWNGLTGVDENPSGGEPTKLYADNAVYGTLYSTEEHGLTIKAYTYPDEFEACDGSAELCTGVVLGQQDRKAFGLAYKTSIGNDTDGNNHGYKLHLVYGCKASPSAKSYATINNSVSATEFSWTVTTTPVNVTGHKPTATLVVDSTKFTSTEAKAKLASLEKALFGGEQDSEKAYLPLPNAVLTLLQ